jgi:hypothetical protein
MKRITLLLVMLISMSAVAQEYTATYIKWLNQGANWNQAIWKLKDNTIVSIHFDTGEINVSDAGGTTRWRIIKKYEEPNGYFGNVYFNGQTANFIFNRETKELHFLYGSGQYGYAYKLRKT